MTLVKLKPTGRRESSANSCSPKMPPSDSSLDRGGKFLLKENRSFSLNMHCMRR